MPQLGIQTYSRRPELEPMSLMYSHLCIPLDNAIWRAGSLHAADVQSPDERSSPSARVPHSLNILLGIDCPRS